MKSRLLWIIVTGLVLAVLLLIAVQTIGVFSNTSEFSNDSSKTSKSESTVDTGITPVIFRTVSEYGDTSARQLRLNGTSEPNAVLIVLNRNERLRQIKADDDGNWTLDIQIKTADIMVIEVVMFAEGGLNVRGDETVFRVPVPNESTSEVINAALIMVTAPGGPTRIIQSPFGGSPTNGPLSMGPIDYDDSGGVIFSGTTEEEGRVRLYAENQVIGETRVGAGGRWNFIAGRQMLPRGEYAISAELIKSDGIRARVTVPFERLAPSQDPDSLPSDIPDIRYEPFRWQIRRQLLGGGAQYTAIFAPQEAEALIVEE